MAPNGEMHLRQKCRSITRPLWDPQKFDVVVVQHDLLMLRHRHLICGCCGPRFVIFGGVYAVCCSLVRSVRSAWRMRKPGTPRKRCKRNRGSCSRAWTSRRSLRLCAFPAREEPSTYQQCSRALHRSFCAGLQNVTLRSKRDVPHRRALGAAHGHRGCHHYEARPGHQHCTQESNTHGRVRSPQVGLRGWDNGRDLLSRPACSALRLSL